MVVYEGRGIVPPSRILVPVTEDDLRLLNAEAERRSNWRGYSGRSDAWGRGLLSGKPVSGVGRVHSSVLPILCGLVGEWAACDFLNNRLGWDEFRLDLGLSKSGDGGTDLHGKRSNLRVQVKCRQKPVVESLVRKTRASGSEVPVTSSVFVFAEWRYGTVCDLLGWVRASAVKRAPVEPSRVANHTNYVVIDEQLEPVSRLVTLVQSVASLSEVK